MANICLTFGTKETPEKLSQALTTLDGLAAWWTGGVSGDPAEDGTIAFRFGEAGGFDMRVVASGDAQVAWLCTAGPDEWTGTRIEFDIIPNAEHTQLMFRHQGWAQECPFYHHCSMKWATFMLSLKEYVETGKGRPFPDDIKIEAVGM